MPLLDAHSPAPPAPRYALAWAALVYALFTLLLAYPALAGDFLVNSHSDQYIAGFPFREFAADWLRAGRGFPMWNPYQFGGMPYVAAMHGDIFYPTFLLRLVMDTDAAMTWSFVLHLFLAGLFTFVFLRAQGFTFFPALTGGTAYMLSGQIASLVSPGHDGKLYLGALLPLFLWTLHRGIRDGRRWSWGLLALVVGLAVLSPHPQLLQYMLLAGAAYALYAAFGSGSGVIDDTPLERSVAVRRLAFALGAIALGGMIGGIQYVPVMEYVPWSPRAGGAGWDHAVSYSMPPEELINTYLPQFSGIIDAYWGRNLIHLHSEYLGAGALLLIGAAFGATAAVRRSYVWFWSGVLVVSLAWALGGYTPFYHLVYAIVPGTKFFRAPSTIFYITAFAAAVLATVGAQRALARQVGAGYLAACVAVAILVALLALGGGFTNIGLAIADPRMGDYVAANQPAVAAGALRSLLFVTLTAAVIIALRSGRLRPVAAGWALAIVLGADLWSIARHYWLFSPPADEVYAADPVIDYLKQQPQPGRVLALQLGAQQGDRRDPYIGGMGRASGLMYHDVRNVLGYHGNEIGRYDVLWGRYEGGAQLANPNFWQLANIRYFLTDVAEPPFEGAGRVAGPVRNAAGTIVYLYEMPGENPAAWVAPAIVKADDNAVLATLREPAFDVRSAALFAPEAPVQGVALSRPPAPLELDVTVTMYEPGRIAVRFDQPAPAGSALIVSENYYPGWRAVVNGEETPIGRADYSLIGVALPERAREVTLTFESDSYETGKMMTAVALLMTAVLLAGGVLMERSRRV